VKLKQWLKQKMCEASAASRALLDENWASRLPIA
jgi:hypothetical protein